MFSKLLLCTGGSGCRRGAKKCPLFQVPNVRLVLLVPYVLLLSTYLSVALQGCPGARALPGRQNDRTPTGYGHVRLCRYGAHGCSSQGPKPAGNSRIFFRLNKSCGEQQREKHVLARETLRLGRETRQQGGRSNCATSSSRGFPGSLNLVSILKSSLRRLTPVLQRRHEPVPCITSTSSSLEHGPIVCSPKPVA